ncbi:GFRAL protein, partial [Polyodon spathula]|nr:GFRAL protein [Polyodon spathula]
EHGSSRSCLEMTMLCIQDEICNRLLVPQIKACSENHNKCNATQCQRAVQKFYDNLPPKVAGMLVFCDCGPSDEPCQQVQGVLHAQLCSRDREVPPTCLEVIDKCMEDTFCRERYKLLQSKCWGDGDGLCQDHDNNEDCLVTPAEGGTACMRYKECRAAYIGTRGTFIQVPCTCSGLQNTEQSMCKQFQNMLRHRSCYSKL